MRPYFLKENYNTNIIITIISVLIFIIILIPCNIIILLLNLLEDGIDLIKHKVKKKDID